MSEPISEVPPPKGVVPESLSNEPDSLEPRVKHLTREELAQAIDDAYEDEEYEIGHALMGAFKTQYPDESFDKIRAAWQHERQWPPKGPEQKS